MRGWGALARWAPFFDDGGNSPSPWNGAPNGTYDAVFVVPVATGVVATDWANISAKVTAAQSCVTAGGHPLVQFQTCPYNVGTSTLTPYAIGNHTIPIVQGVSYIGVPPLIDEINKVTGQYEDADFQYVGGTVFKGDGTAPGMAFNNVDQGGLPANLGATVAEGVTLYGLGFDTVTYGIQAGAANTMGLVWSIVDQIVARNCSQWGVYFVNYLHVDFGRITTCLCTTGGQYYASKLPVATLGPGNSLHRDLSHFTSSAVNTARGIVFEAYSASGPASFGCTIQNMQHNAFNRTAISQTATFNGTSTVAVVDGTTFAVGMPVYFTTTGFGFTAQQIYVVQSVAGNNLTLGSSKYQAGAITASGSGTLTIQTTGFSHFEFVANGGGNIQVRVDKLDAEGNPTVGAYIEAANGRIGGPANLGGTVGAVARASSVSVVAAGGVSYYDFDPASFRSDWSGFLDATPLNFAVGGTGHAGPYEEMVFAPGQYQTSKVDPWPAGYYRSAQAISYPGMAMVHDQMYLTPVDLPARTLTAIGINVTGSGQSGAVIRLGLYHDQNGLPAGLALDAGTVAGDSTGYKEIVISQAVVPGTYWLVAVAQNCSTTPPSVTGHVPTANIGASSGSSACTGSSTGLFAVPFTGALPSSFTPGGGTGQGARVVVKAA